MATPVNVIHPASDTTWAVRVRIGTATRVAPPTRRVASRNTAIGHSFLVMEPLALRVSLLGGFELRQGTDVIPVESGRVRSLIAWLALHADGPQPRQRVAYALWPDSSDSQARTNLRNLLHQLRRAFADIDLYLQAGGPLLEWRAGAPLSIDVAEFERALSSARDAGAHGTPQTAKLEAALALYRGPLLPDCYEPWVVDEQARLARLHRTGLDVLLERYLEDDAFGPARETAERILRDDPLSEGAHRARIVACAARDDRAGALHAYHECESLLSAELGVAPSRATQEAVRFALSAAGQDDGGEGASGDRPAATELLVSDPRREAGLIGRERELSWLQRSWASALESGARMVLVTGEPGIGKTRLVQALADRLVRQGHRVVQSRAYPTQGALAYGPVVGWLRSPVLTAALTGAPAATRAELARLLPELEPAEQGQDAEPLTEAERRQRIHDAAIAVLSVPDGPSALIIDDLQWSDRETVDLLHGLVLRSPRPLLIAATLRTGEVDDEDALVSTIAALAAADRLERVELQPLGLAETGQLARALSEDEVADERVPSLYRESEGNPLFIVELVRSGRSWGDDRDVQTREHALNPRIRSVIEARLSLLSAAARTVTRIAATMGREFTLPLLLRVSPLDETATLRGLDEAWRRRLVRERGDGSYDFSHDKIREVAYRTTSPIRRRIHHARIAGVMEAAWDSGTAGPETTADQIALHHDRGGSVAHAVAWYVRAARAATEVSALDAVRQLLSRALELLERLPQSAERDRDELDMRLAFGPVLVALEGYGRRQVVETYERAHVLCDRLGRPVTPPILRARALAALAGGDLEGGSALGRELVDVARRNADDVAAVEGAYVSGVMAFWQGDLEKSERFLVEAIDRYRPERHRDHVVLYAQDPKVVCLSRLAWTLWHRGRVAEALARRDEAIELAEHHGDPHGLAYTLWFTLFVAIEHDGLDRIAAQTERMKHIATHHRLDYIDVVADGFSGYVEALRGDARAGITRMRATLADPRWFGMDYVLRLQTLYLLARAAAAAGDTVSARATVEEAIDYLGPGPSIWKATFAQLAARLSAVDDRTGERALPAFQSALHLARLYGSAWAELSVAIDHARWSLERHAGDRVQASEDLERTLIAYAGAPPIPAVTAANILLERLQPEMSL